MANLFINGMGIKKPSAKAPDCIKASISVNIESFVKFATEHQVNGWLNIDIKQSKAGQLYLALNQYKKVDVEKAESDVQLDEEIPVSEIPF